MDNEANKKLVELAIVAAVKGYTVATMDNEYRSNQPIPARSIVIAVEAALHAGGVPYTIGMVDDIMADMGDRAGVDLG